MIDHPGVYELFALSENVESVDKQIQFAVASIGTASGPSLEARLSATVDELGHGQPTYSTYETPRELMRSEHWGMAIILSPYKRCILKYCDTLTPSCKASGVGDTLIRTAAGQVYAFNTNIYGLTTAVNMLVSERAIQTCLILGTGATARCAALTMQRVRPDARVYSWGRNANAVNDLCSLYGNVEPVNGALTSLATRRWDLVIHCTTVGETHEMESDPDFGVVVRDGTLFLDVNNRSSTVQMNALRRGGIVMSGGIMQATVSSLRGYLLSGRL